MRRALAALAACASAAAFAADDVHWYMKMDNDVVFRTDRWYSSGVRLARVAPADGGAVEWGLVHEVFTPESKHFVPGLTIDRAPTARLLASGARHWTRDEDWVTLEGQVGVRGRGAAGEQVTRTIHRLTNGPYVDWSGEVPSEFDARIAGAVTHRSGGLDVHGGAVVGSELSFAHLGLQWNAGPVRIASEPLRYVATPPFTPGTDTSYGRGAFLGASIRVVANDRTLERGYDPALPHPKQRRGIVRLAAGTALVHPWGTVVFTVVRDSPEFATQRAAQQFGSLVVYIPF